MDQPKYRIEIFWSDEDGGYIANVPDLRYCSAFGESYEEALREVLVAMDLHLDTLRELGRSIPEPGSHRGVAVSTIVLESGQSVELTEEAGGFSAQLIDESGEVIGSVGEDKGAGTRYFVSGHIGAGAGQLVGWQDHQDAAQQAQDAASQAAGQMAQQQGQQAQQHATQAAYEKAEELGVDITQVEGSGSGGLVTVRDVVDAANM